MSKRKSRLSMFRFPFEDLQEPFKGRNKTFQIRTEQRASLFKKPHSLYIGGYRSSVQTDAGLHSHWSLES